MDKGRKSHCHSMEKKMLKKNCNKLGHLGYYFWQYQNSGDDSGFSP